MEHPAPSSTRPTPKAGVPTPEEMLLRFDAAMTEAGFPNAPLRLSDWRWSDAVDDRYSRMKDEGWPCVAMANAGPNDPYIEAYQRACELAYGVPYPRGARV